MNRKRSSKSPDKSKGKTADSESPRGETLADFARQLDVGALDLFFRVADELHRDAASQVSGGTPEETVEPRTLRQIALVIGRSGSSISDAIESVERAVGDGPNSLVDRGRWGSRLTPAGRDLLVKGRALHDHYLDFLLRQREAKNSTVPLRVAGIPSILDFVLADPIEKFRRENPSVDFAVRAVHSREIAFCVETGAIDHAYAWEGVAYDTAKIEHSIVCNVQYCLIARKSGGKNPDADVLDMLNHRPAYIAFQGPDDSIEAYLRALRDDIRDRAKERREDQRTTSNAVVETKGHFESLFFARAGLGVAVSPYWFVKSERNAELLHFLPLKDVKTSGSFPEHRFRELTNGHDVLRLRLKEGGSGPRTEALNEFDDAVVAHAKVLSESLKPSSRRGSS
jgi:DNA-binding transcriptional LysR family regulator